MFSAQEEKLEIVGLEKRKFASMGSAEEVSAEAKLLKLETRVRSLNHRISELKFENERLRRSKQAIVPDKSDGREVAKCLNRCFGLDAQTEEHTLI